MTKETIIVTGAAGGVGLALVKKLAGRYRVVAIHRRDEQAEMLRSVATDVLPVKADLSDASHVGPALQKVLTESGLSLKAVVSCAAVWPGEPLELIDLDELRQVFETNVFSPLAIYQACIPALRKSIGRVVLVGSISGKLALPFNGAYAMSKFALEALADTARREAEKWGVQTVMVEPGPIRTPMVTNMMEHLDRSRADLSAETEALYGDLYGNFKAMVEKGYPQATDPAEVADVIIEAIEAAQPETRMPVGDAARFICNLPRTHEDRAIDQIAISVVTGTPN